MSLIIAPDEGFDSYISAADADAYIAKMGITGWPPAATEAQKEASLRTGTRYIRTVYAPQGRYLDPVHADIAAATVEAAMRADVLFTDVKPAAITERTIGPLTTKYATAKNDGQIRFGVIDALMRGLGGMTGVMMLKRI